MKATSFQRTEDGGRLPDAGYRIPDAGFPVWNTAGRPKGNPNWFRIVNQGSETEPAEIEINGFIGSDPFSNEANDCKRISAELKAIPKGRKINLSLHSQGGNVFEGLGIYDLIRERRADVTCRIRGLAASAGSFIACAAGKIVMPASARFMIHDAQTITIGDKADMEYAAQRLDQESENIAAIYAEKTGKPKDQCRGLMKATTWMNGYKAKEQGFVDEVTSETVLNCSDLSFDGITDDLPEDLRNEISAGSGGSTPNPNRQPTTLMNRAQIEAWLKKRHIAFQATATDAELIALMENYEPPKPATAPIPPNTPTPVADANVVLVDIQAQLAEERRENVTAAVEECVTMNRIPGDQADFWVENILRAPTAKAGKAILAKLQAMPSVPVGVEPVNVTVTAEMDSKLVAKQLNRLRDPIKSMLIGNEVAAKEIQNAAAQASRTILKMPEGYWAEFFNTNTHTIDSNLQRTVILTQVMRDFKRKVMPVTAFSTVFANVPLEGTDKATVPYYALNTVASTPFNQSNGYVFTEDSTTDSREVTVNKRQYKPFLYNSSDLRRQPYLSVVELTALQAAQLGLDVVNDVLSVVTAANYGGAVKNLAAPSFNSDVVTDIGTVADLCDWPDEGRTLILDTRYKGELLKDPSIKSAMESGSPAALRMGAVGMLSNFNILPYSRIPGNGENLVGMAVFKSAILVATAPIKPAPGVLKQLVSYDLVIDPDSGLAFEYRFWGNPDKDEDREVIECNYGYAVGQGKSTFAVADDLTPTNGNGNALMRITKPA